MGKFFKKTMTGAEAYRAVRFFLLECYRTSDNEYAYWLANALDTDPALVGDWEDAIEEMLEERDEFGNEKLINRAENLPVYVECGCWEERIRQRKKSLADKKE